MCRAGGVVAVMAVTPRFPDCVAEVAKDIRQPAKAVGDLINGALSLVTGLEPVPGAVAAAALTGLA
ncbi:hypothetical protein ACFCX0_49270, partial [Streptomyces sp. NPDC056352]|uniref:hypothetical protein n=1 Tax=Streptomyces sp. NPDC056352 TaxID=3345791 RepID=UPI0035E23143